MKQNERRNVITIMCDQLRPDFLHAYGADFIPTPNIDALAADGVVFDNAITASTVCAPARMSFLTGLPVSGHDAWTNQVLPREGVLRFPERLSEDGYLTGCVGGWDFEPFENPSGFVYRKNFTYECNRDETNCEYCHELRRRYPDLGEIYQYDETHHYPLKEEDFWDYWTADCAIEFIESYAKTGKAPNGAAAGEDAPFFLLCDFCSPHAPNTPPREVAGTVDPARIPKVRINPRPDEDLPTVEIYRRALLNPIGAILDPESVIEARMQERLLYCELIVEVDRLVGRIVESLKENGLYENTTIVFTSDHGSCDNDYNLATKGPYPYYPQLFIPMIVANHPSLEKGTHCDALCGNLDIGATVFDIAGDERAFGVSRSMIGLATGEVAERDVNLSEFCDSCKTIVDKRYTFTYYPFTGKCTLFDRKEDPRETVNLADRKEYAATKRRFLQHAIDMTVLAKGIRIEAHDLTPDVFAGIKKKHPKFLDNFDIAYPFATMGQIENIRAAGLDPTINEFCKERPVMAHYGLYFEDQN